MQPEYILIKGAGDLASGVACTLHRAGYRVMMNEIEQPTCVRRKASFAEAIYEGQITIEGITGCRVEDLPSGLSVMEEGKIAVRVDPGGHTLGELDPAVYIEATLSKRNTNLTKNDCGIVIALGPGFEAGTDAHAVIETQRGPELGRVILSGFAAANTGIPGNVLGHTSDRVMRAPAAGKFENILDIGDYVEAGDIVGYAGNEPVKAAVSGVIRGLLRPGLLAPEGMKLGDIHPEKDRDVCARVTDKAWAVGEGVLRAIDELQGK